MKSSDLKEFIVEEECIDTILEDLGCGNIVKHSGYYSCSNPDGNNKSAVVVYINDNLTTINYTRNIIKNKRSADLFDLVSFYRDCSFPETLKYVHELLGLDYYQEKEEPCESLQILRMLKDMQSNDNIDKDEPLRPISEKILEYYLPYGNALFENDGITLEVQQEFGIGYDPSTNRITIPIRSPIGDLCGVKGRLFGAPDEFHSKYLYIEPTMKTNLLYGLYENRDYIKQANQLMIFEAERSVLKCASFGYRNCVATGGKKISKTQVELITRSGCTPILCMDKDVEYDELLSLANMFMDGIDVYAIIDKNNLMREKDSPCDNDQVFLQLLANNIYKIK